MRLVTFCSRNSAADTASIGSLIDDDRSIVMLSSASSGDVAFDSMIALMESGNTGLDKAREVEAGARRSRAHVIPRDRVKLLAPVPRPVSMRDWACFPGHLVNVGRAIHLRKAAQEADPKAAFERYRASGVFDLPPDYYELPRFHSTNRNSVIGPEDEVQWPSFSELMDFELEFGIFIGRQGKDIGLAEASGYIFGYTIFNDFTARDMQMREGRQGGKGKEFDTGNVLGPCIVTADEIPEPYRLTMIARVNGEVWVKGSSSQMGRTFEQIISHMSSSTTIYPGEFFGSGTLENGSGMEHDRFLNHGDVIELEVERIGVLRTRIVKSSRQAVSD